jgi:hypothetical protein
MIVVMILKAYVKHRVKICVMIFLGYVIVIIRALKMMIVVMIIYMNVNDKKRIKKNRNKIKID